MDYKNKIRPPDIDRFNQKQDKSNITKTQRLFLNPHHKNILNAHFVQDVVKYVYASLMPAEFILLIPIILQVGVQARSEYKEMNIVRNINSYQETSLRRHHGL